MPVHKYSFPLSTLRLLLLSQSEQKVASGLCKMKNRSWEGSGIAKNCTERLFSLSLSLNYGHKSFNNGSEK